jgi:hypothetical protein
MTAATHRCTTHNRCEAEGWNDGTEYVCDLPPGHDGKHVDVQEGWEW